MISIPYGSIKSIQIAQTADLILEFQFLMVQLKVFGCAVSDGSPCVSIPYGSIKRRKSRLKD